MDDFLILALLMTWLGAGAGCWLGWQLLRQQGRMLLRLDALERGPDELDFDSDSIRNGKHKSLARSRINRDGLKAGTLAPDFRLPRVDGGELALEDLRRRRVLLVFSDPHCGPCNHLVPQLEQFHCEHPEIALVMISRRDAETNRAKVNEHGLTFPVVLQPHWEISRLYAMFATPIAYLIDESGIIAKEVAVGVEPILALMANANAVILETAEAAR